jgi:hypothetical protein
MTRKTFVAPTLVAQASLAALTLQPGISGQQSPPPP